MLTECLAVKAQDVTRERLGHPVLQWVIVQATSCVSGMMWRGLGTYALLLVGNNLSLHLTKLL